ncbi:MAG: YiiX family permuted papain-like enzyme [Bacteroidia bacterium]|nr:YiiX family permuted papain-like enzyme [Bacteroidia bacterium]
MKKAFVIIAVSVTTYFCLNFKQTTNYKEGDIIFQTTSGRTGKAIQLATHSKFNHCGVLFLENNKWVVYEAVQPVKKTSLEDFNARGIGTVKRLASKALSKEEVNKLKTQFKTYEHKDYDEAFNWSDERIYCSELVYKLYNNGLHIELCKSRKLSDFDLNNPLVKEKLNEKYGNKIPLNEPMVSPEDIYKSTLLINVK